MVKQPQIRLTKLLPEIARGSPEAGERRLASALPDMDLGLRLRRKRQIIDYEVGCLIEDGLMIHVIAAAVVLGAVVTRPPVSLRNALNHGEHGVWRIEWRKGKMRTIGDYFHRSGCGASCTFRSRCATCGAFCALHRCQCQLYESVQQK